MATSKPKKSKKRKPGYTRLVIPRDEQKAIDLLDSQQLRVMLQKANAKGRPYSKQAAADLRRLYTRIGNIANKRLKELEKAGKAYYAYDRLQQTIKNNFTGKRLVTAKAKVSDIDIRKVYDLLQESLLFVKAPTSTPEGIDATDKKRIETFREKWGLNIPKGSEQLFLDFLGSAEWNGIQDLVGSDVLVDDLGHLFNEGNSLEQVIDAFNKVVNKQVEYEDALEDMGYLL